MLEQLKKEIKAIDNFSDAEVELFISYLDETFVEKGDHFLNAGQISQHFGYIKSGLMMHYKIHEGTEIPCDFTAENQWLGYLKSFTSRTPSDMSIKALEDTRLLRLSASSLQELFQQHPKFMSIKNYYVENSFIVNTQHSADLVMLDAKQLYYKFMREKPGLINRVPQYYIAAYLGIKPQSLSRIRKEG